MNWLDAETAIRSHIETQWALGSYTSIPLVFENEHQVFNDKYMIVNIEGTFAEKSIYGTAGNRISQEYGIVFFHSFGQEGVGKNEILGSCVAMVEILELRVISSQVYMEGANPPSPVETQDDLIPNQQPSGQYYRCSGSVPFNFIGTK